MATKKILTDITSDGSIESTSFIKTGGTSSQFLKADGSVSTGGSGTVDGTGTEGYVPRWKAGGTGLEDSIIQASIAAVGIGRAPSFPLDVNGAIAASGTGNIFNYGTFLYTNMSRTGDGIINIYGNGADTENFIITNNGSDTTLSYDTSSITMKGANVGIGTDVPNSPLHIYGTIDGEPTTMLIENGDTTIASGQLVANLEFQANDASTNGAGTMGQLAMVAENDGSIYGMGLYTKDGTPGVNEVMRLSGDGNVGIGTTDPQAKLHVSNGSLRTWTPTLGTSAIFESTVSNRNFVTITAANEAEVWFGDATIQARGRIRYEMADDSMEFWTDAKERMKIDSKGNVGIGTDTPESQVGSTRILNMSSTGNGEVILDHIDAGTTSDIGLYSWNRNKDHLAHIKATCDGATDSAYISFHAQATGGSFANAASNEKMRIQSNGNVGIGTTSPSTALDVDGAISTTTSDFVQGSTGSRLLLETSGSGNTHSYIQAQGSGGTSNAEDLALQLYGGNVGIGTAGPDVKLEVESTTSASGIRIKNTNSGFASIDIESNRVVGANLGGLRYRKTGEAASQAEINYVAGTRFDFLLGSGASSPAHRLSILQGGNVGIGTNAPTQLLHLKSSGPARLLIEADSDNNIETDNAQILLSQDGGAVTATLGYKTNTNGLEITNEYLGADGTLTFGTSDTQRMIIEAGGDIGIALTNPRATFHVAGTTATLPALGAEASAMQVGGESYGTLFTTLTTGTGIIQQGRNDGITTSYDLLLQPVGGDVGIGTSSPNAKLEVAGATRITGTGLDVGYGNNGTNYVQVGYGRTTNGYALLDLIGDSTYSDYGFRILRNNGGPNTDTDFLHRGTGDLDFKTLDAGDIGFYTTSIQRMIVKSDGDVGIGDTTPSYKLDVAGTIRATGDVIAYSDRRVKENIETIKDASLKVSKLRGVEFNKIGEDEKSIGVIAQEIEEVMPEVVKTDDKGMKAVAYGNLVGLLIESNKELIERIEKLEGIINNK